MFKSMNVNYPLKVTRFAVGMPELRDKIGKLILSVNHISGNAHYRDDVQKILQFAADGINAKFKEVKNSMSEEIKEIEKEVEVIEDKPQEEIVEETVEETVEEKSIVEKNKVEKRGRKKGSKNKKK